MEDDVQSEAEMLLSQILFGETLISQSLSLDDKYTPNQPDKETSYEEGDSIRDGTISNIKTYRPEGKRGETKKEAECRL